jgi:hypothetical protein
MKDALSNHFISLLTKFFEDWKSYLYIQALNTAVLFSTFKIRPDFMSDKKRALHKTLACTYALLPPTLNIANF